MTTVERPYAMDALASVYRKVTVTVEALDEAEMMRPSRCAGWTVADVLYHQLLDARRALRTFATPSADPVDVDYVSYWRSFSPGNADAAAHARHVRIVASAYPTEALVWEWRETSAAASRAARACPYETVSTQGHSLRTADFIATLAVEAAVHYLDLAVELPAAEPPDPASLALVRSVLDGLLGTKVPIDWDDRTYALKGTGRVGLTAEERSALGSLADRFPLFG
jgi:uncharacterized protein (TIGR03083 family)